jgi:hypothetical protein
MAQAAESILPVTKIIHFRGGTRGRLKLHNFRSAPPRALPDSKSCSVQSPTCIVGAQYVEAE